MNRIVLALPLVFGLMAFTQPLPPPIAPANEGKLLCILPEEADKTCDTLVRYTPGEAGRTNVFEWGVFDATRQIHWEGNYQVEIRDGLLCLRVSVDQAEMFRLTGGDQTSAQMLKLSRQFFIATTMAMARHDMCMMFVPDGSGGDGLMLDYWFDGQPSKVPDEPAMWVSPEDGYRPRG
jgi:hypothetical protein